MRISLVRFEYVEKGVRFIRDAVVERERDQDAVFADLRNVGIENV